MKTLTRIMVPCATLVLLSGLSMGQILQDHCNAYNSSYSRYVASSAIETDPDHTYHDGGGGHDHQAYNSTSAHEYCTYLTSGYQWGDGSWACSTTTHLDNLQFSYFEGGGVTTSHQALANANTIGSSGTYDGHTPTGGIDSYVAFCIVGAASTSGLTVPYCSVWDDTHPTYTGPAPGWIQAVSDNGLTCPQLDANTNITPIVLAWGNSQFQNSFTDASKGQGQGLGPGVVFGVSSPTDLVRFGWPKQNANVGFLVLPDSGDQVHSLKWEMFGNLTHQFVRQIPMLREDVHHQGFTTYQPNGFEAMAVYDMPEYGGNSNGLLDPGDKVWKKLRIWVNSAHNGDYDEINKPNEIFTLDQLGVTSIDVKNYTRGYVTDGHGNLQKYVGTVNAKQPMQIYDVVLVHGPFDQKNP